MSDHQDFIQQLVERIRALISPMDPVPTGVVSKIQPLAGIRAVLFDVYGTLFISGSGDIGVLQEMQTDALFAEALAASGFSICDQQAGAKGRESVARIIQRTHTALREQGIDQPEVDIHNTWRDVLSEMLEAGLIDGDVSRASIQRMAIEHECRVNPVWPMPGVLDVLERLRERDVVMGIVSNAQFYTALLFNALLAATPKELGFDPVLCIWSYTVRTAKPSPRLFERGLDLLEERHNISPEETLYVGNDMLNDIWPAAKLGCRTALFAGDKRSLRMREDDVRCASLKPDVVITDLRELSEVLK